jgi:hypothetical protein
MILAALMAAPALDDPMLSTEGIAWVITSQLDTWLGKALLITVAVAISRPRWQFRRLRRG